MNSLTLLFTKLKCLVWWSLVEVQFSFALVFAAPSPFPSFPSLTLYAPNHNWPPKFKSALSLCCRSAVTSPKLLRAPLVLHMALANTFIFRCCLLSARFVMSVHDSYPLLEDFNPRRGASAGVGPGSGRPAQKRSHCLLPASFPAGRVPVSGVSSKGISPALGLQLSQLQELAGLVAGSESAASSASTGEFSASTEMQCDRKPSGKAAAPCPKKKSYFIQEAFDIEHRSCASRFCSPCQQHRCSRCHSCRCSSHCHHFIFSAAGRLPLTCSVADEIDRSIDFRLQSPENASELVSWA